MVRAVGARRRAAQFAAQRDGKARQGAGRFGAAAVAARRSHRVCGRCGVGSVGRIRRRRRGCERRSDELRLLEILRDRRLALQLLRRHVEQLPAGHDAFADHVDRHLPQPARRVGLHRVVQRLLRQDLVRQVLLQPQRAREAAVQAVAEQRHQLVHGER
ncbi:hypothetical protein F01_480190 [Burkholderia cenocepacia]|nr:hypothetical protein F01_480190 [Burkholderia cenocepacia]